MAEDIRGELNDLLQRKQFLENPQAIFQHLRLQYGFIDDPMGMVANYMFNATDEYNYIDDRINEIRARLNRIGGARKKVVKKTLAKKRVIRKPVKRVVKKK